MIKIKTAYIILFALIIGACTNTSNENQKPQVTVSIIPQKFFVNEIAGDYVAVNVMVPPGASPATYEPTPKQMKNLSSSVAYFRIGHIAFEKAWMYKLASINPKMKIIDTSEGLELLNDEEFNELHTDSHGHSHSHDGYNPHIWLSPNLVKAQSNKILETLTLLYPEQANTFTKNHKRFIQRCDSVQIVMNQHLTKAKGSSFIVYHPVWTYLANDYELNQIAIEHNGKEASVAKLKYIIDFAKANNIETIFVQQEFNDAQAKTIANEINGKVIKLNPLHYDWFKTMDEFTKAFN